VQLGSPESRSNIGFEQDFSTTTGIRLSCLRSSRCWIWRCCQRLGLIQHHDALRLRFHPTDAGYQRSFAESCGSSLVTHVDLADLPPSDQVSAITTAAGVAQTSLNISRSLLRVIYFNLGAKAPGRLLIAIHHLVMMAFLAHPDGRSGVGLPGFPDQHYTASAAQNTSYKQWATLLKDYAQSPPAAGRTGLMERVLERTLLDSHRFQLLGVNSEASVRSVKVSLDRDATQALLKQVPAAYNADK